MSYPLELQPHPGFFEEANLATEEVFDLSIDLELQDAFTTIYNDLVHE